MLKLTVFFVTDHFLPNHHLYSVFVNSLSIFEIYIKFTAKTWNDQMSIYSRWSTVICIIFSAINRSFKIVIIRKVHVALTQ